MLSSALPRPYGGQTKAFTSTDISSGFFGYSDTTTTAGVRLFFANSAQQSSTWSGWITGHTCTVRWRAPGSSPNAILISVDGAPYFLPNFPSPTTDSTQTVFRGLADKRHFVEIRSNIAGGYSGASGPFTSGTVFTVTGENPTIDFSGWGTSWLLTQGSFPGIIGSAAVARYASASGVNVTPAINEITNTVDGNTPANYLRAESFKIKAQCSEIWIWGGCAYAHYSIDGSSWTKVTFNDGTKSVHQNGAARSWKRLAVGLDNTTTHDYYIYPGNTSFEFGTLGSVSTWGVMLDASGTFSSVGTTKRIATFGDSITEGVNNAGQTNSAVYINQAASALGALAILRGKGGITAATLDTDTSSILSAMGYVPDIAEVAIGRNDGGTASAAFKTSYTSIINKILTNGTNKVICRGTSLGGLSGTRDTDISDAVTAIQGSLVGAQAVTYVSTVAWTGIPTADGTHPTEAGYATMAGYAVTDYGATGFF